MKKYLLLFLFILFCKVSGAQSWKKNLKVYSSIGTVVGNDSLAPFLLRANQYGTLLKTANFVYSSAGLSKQYDSLYTIDKKLKRFDYGYGAEAHLNLGIRAQNILLPELFFKARYGAFEFYAGRRREIQGLVDTVGTMGSYIWPGNALPMPKVELSIPNYIPILRSGLISMKGNFAHGWFGDGDSVKNYWLHQKSIYFRIGKPAWKIRFYGGFNHQVQWGGRPAKPFYDEISKQTISKFGSDFSTFIQVATGLRVSKLGEWDNQTGVSANEAGNRSGNHLGSVDIAMEYDVSGVKLLLYRQSFYDDGSLFYLNNIVDGLNGISVTKREGWLRKICFEYLNTTNQGGSLFFDQRPELRGRDDYFNNGLYKDGWAYKGNTIGTPFIYNNSTNGFKEYPNMNYMINNRVKSYSFFVMSKFSEFLLTNKILRNINYWNYEINKLPIREFQTLTEIMFNKKNWQYKSNFVTQFSQGKVEFTLGFRVTHFLK